MTGEVFEAETLRNLERHCGQCPEAEAGDAVKFIFQALLGAGHLLSSRERVLDYLQTEMEGLEPDRTEPFYDLLSPAYCRLNLRRAMAEGVPAEIIADLMTESVSAFRFTRRDVLALCRKWAEAGLLCLRGEADPDRVTDERWLPSHSAAYRAARLPAYRVVSTDWIPCLEAVTAVNRGRSDMKRMTVSLDGPCASGKTTLAHVLARIYGAAVVHMDDFVVPHAMKTPERLAVPGGNCDAERLVREVLAPWKAGAAVRYRRYDCGADRLLTEETLPDCGMLILEGCCVGLPAIRGYTDVRLFLDAPWKRREARLRERETADSMRRFEERWIPLENAYFEAYHLPAGISSKGGRVEWIPRCVCLDGGGEGPCIG